MVGRKTLLFLAHLLLPGVLGADTGGSVVLVYNRSMAESKRVADHYAAKRQVPAQQILAFDLPETETISRGDFESKLLQPLWTALKSRKLLTYRENGGSSNGELKSNVTEAAVRYIVLCYGVPLKITPDNTRKEALTEKLPQELRRNEAAVESELALLPLLDQNLPLSGPMSNPAVMATNRFSIHPTNGVMIVARLDGPTPEIAMGLVDKALQAEQGGLWGNAYIDSRGIADPGLKQGDEMIKAAGELARLYGYEVVQETSDRTFPPSTPMSDIAFYFGWYDQSVSGPFTNGMAEFRPGAVAYHLHSFSARHLRTKEVWWAGPLLAAGATATMGCTEEPYLQATPHINGFMWRFVQQGFSFGEAALASQPSLSWQIAVIGDPLYRPFSKNQKERYEELEARKGKDLEWSMLMWVNFLLANNAPLNEVLQYYRETPAAESSAILQEKLADVYKSKGKLFDSIDPYSKALKLPMTSLQRLRITLKAASIFSSMGRTEQAYGLYQGLLRDYPHYAGKKDLYERLSGVAMRLKKTAEAADYQRLARDQSQL